MDGSLRSCSSTRASVLGTSIFLTVTKALQETPQVPVEGVPYNLLAPAYSGRLGRWLLEAFPRPVVHPSAIQFDTR